MTEQSALDQKLFAIMAEVKTLPRSGWNDYHKYHYVTAEAVSALMRGLLVKHGVLLEVRPVDYERWENNVVVMSLEIILKDKETGEKKTYSWFAPAQDKNDKGMYKAYTTGMKYFWMTQFVIASGESDADSGRGTETTTSKPTRPSAPAKPKLAPEQKLRIIELMDGLEIPNQKRAKTLKDAGFAALTKLTPEEADKVIARMEKALAEKVNGS